MTEKEQEEMDEMLGLFETYQDMVNFKESYIKELKNKPEEINVYKWESVAEDIVTSLGDKLYELEDSVEVEINSGRTISGHPELINCGQLTEIPVPDPGMVNDPKYNDETGYLGEYTGNYKLSFNYVKEMFPDSLLTTPDRSVSELLGDAVRSNARWFIPETREK